MDINELRKFTEFIYAQYTELKAEKQQQTETLMNLNAQLYDNRQLLAEIRKSLEESESEKSKMQGQLVDMSKRMSDLMKEILDLKRSLKSSEDQNAILKTAVFSSKSYKRKKKEYESGRDDDKDDFDGTQPSQVVEEADSENIKERAKERAKEKEERPYR